MQRANASSPFLILLESEPLCMSFCTAESASSSSSWRLITLPFAFFGVDYYFRSTGSHTGDRDRLRQAITQRNSPTRCASSRSACGRSQVATSTRRCSTTRKCATRARAADRSAAPAGSGAARSAPRLRRPSSRNFISEIPAFQDEGKFSHTRYEQLLASQNKTPAGFEQDAAGAAYPRAAAGADRRRQHRRPDQCRALPPGCSDQQREVAAAVIEVEPYLKGVKIDDEAVKAFTTPMAARSRYPRRSSSNT